MTAQEQLRKLLHYDPDTGVFTRLVRTSSRVNIGDIAGSKHVEGYWTISVEGRQQLAHRLAFLYMTGELPALVDHINGVRTDNRWANLREASFTANAENRVNRPWGNNPFMGVSWDKTKNKWLCCITVNNKTVNLGRFTDPAEAHQVYLKAKRELHAGCTI